MISATGAKRQTDAAEKLLTSNSVALALFSRFFSFACLILKIRLCYNILVKMLVDFNEIVFDLK